MCCVLFTTQIYPEPVINLWLYSGSFIEWFDSPQPGIYVLCIIKIFTFHNRCVIKLNCGKFLFYVFSFKIRQNVVLEACQREPLLLWEKIYCNTSVYVMSIMFYQRVSTSCPQIYKILWFPFVGIRQLSNNVLMVWCFSCVK